MATSYWTSSQYKHWVVDRVTLRHARADDLRHASARELALITIFFANVITRLGKRLEMRQQVIATAIVFFRRFYLKNSYCETEPFFVAAACCYVAAKVEEAPVHLKSVVGEARNLFGQEWHIHSIPSDHTKLGEMEFYLLEDLEFNLVVFHPYHDLADLCTTQDAEDNLAKKGLQTGKERGKLVLDEGAMQTAWFIINDSFRTELCLVHPPYLIAVAALYMTCVLHNSISGKLHPPNQPQPPTSAPMSAGGFASARQSPAPFPLDGRSTPTASSSLTPISTTPTSMSPRDEILNFLASLNVSLETVSTVCQEIMSMYSLWDTFTDRSEQDKNRRNDRRESQRGWFRGSPPPEKDLIEEKEIVKIVENMRKARCVYF
ncbi:cyclin-like protein [Clavulina sp. PMI_390]|nr:cyclin-like protein [Clavulina sp. PMI_390]